MRRAPDFSRRLSGEPTGFLEGLFGLGGNQKVGQGLFGLGGGRLDLDVDSLEVEFDEHQGPDHLVYPLDFAGKVGAAEGDFRKTVAAESSGLEETDKKVALVVG